VKEKKGKMEGDKKEVKRRLKNQRKKYFKKIKYHEMQLLLIVPLHFYNTFGSLLHIVHYQPYPILLESTPFLLHYIIHLN